MTDSVRQDGPYPDPGAGLKDVISEPTQARALEAHIRPHDSSDISLHLQELLDHLANAGFALAVAVGD
jgi:hypothetical protein